MILGVTLQRFIDGAFLAPGTKDQAGSEAMNLIVKYDKQGNFDEAIKVGQDWTSKHPEDPLYNQIALCHLAKAAKDGAHKDEWIRQGVACYGKDLETYKKGKVDFELYAAGRGFEYAGDLSSSCKCLYYDRALKAFDEEFPYIQGDRYTADGASIPLAPVRHENQKALDRVKSKIEKTGCGQAPPALGFSK
ncbi:MAG TPA: hypothetical protein VJR23_14385 [Candidatus Acidoferrales bacterium]|nr:hypothetical protein [Candidatus Acidoferrales bacterium]